MRQYFWGFLLGAAAVYWYTYYGYQLTYAKHYVDSWRDHAVTETRGYSEKPRK